MQSLHVCSENIDEVSRIREKLEGQGCVLPPMKPKESHFDSNCITPGTEFMARLAKCLRYYVHDRMNNNPAWQGVMVGVAFLCRRCIHIQFGNGPVQCMNIVGNGSVIAAC